MRRRIYERQCVQCGNTFTATRTDARFCSDACDQAAWRGKRDGYLRVQTENPRFYHWIDGDIACTVGGTVFMSRNIKTGDVDHQTTNCIGMLAKEILRLSKEAK